MSMSYQIIDGKKISGEIKDEVRDNIARLKEQGVELTLAVVQVGADPASSVYVRNKTMACDYTGIRSLTYNLPEDTSEADLLKLVDELNARADVNGILVQLPLPRQINEDHIIHAIDPKKDVDGFHPYNVGCLSIGEPGFVSCTPAGMIELLKRSDISMDGKHCVVVSRSNIVGKPMAMLMLRENATVTICHSHTRDLSAITREADILIAAVGKPKFFTADYVKEGAAVVDVGIHRKEGSKKLCGDVDFDTVAPHCSAITPVPGGVGPMTIAMLMRNCLYSAEIQGRVSWDSISL